MSSKFTKKKLLVFHNEKAVSHLETQPNQSYFVESLILKDLEPQNFIDLQQLLQNFLQKPDNIVENDISNSVFSILQNVT